MRRVLVATWGNPFPWEEIGYRVNCKDWRIEGCNDVEMKNVSTLPVLLKALNPEKTIILVLDTLANLTLRNDVPKKELGSYEMVKKDVEERVRWFIDNKVLPLVEDGKTRELLKEAKIVVAPGIGEFDNASVEGDVLDFYYFVLKTLAEELPTEDTEVFLDLTHGINFMPVLTYRALKNLLGLLAYLRTVRLHVMNSEPIPSGEKPWKEEIVKSKVLNIHLIESEELGPRPMYSIFRDRNDKKKREWSAFISSVANGFPLVFATFYPKINSVMGIIEASLKEFDDSIEVSMKPDIVGKTKVHVVRKRGFNRDFKTAVKLYYLLRVLQGEFGGKYPKEGVTTKELSDITKKLFVKMPRIGVVVEKQVSELSELEEGKGVYEDGTSRRIPGILDKIDKDKKLNDLKKRKGLSYGELRKTIKLGSSSGDSLNPEPGVRNFIAHSGFEYNLVWVRYENGKLVWFYPDKEKVIEFSIEALKMRLPEDGKEVV
ncbi:CRISPR-associated CARF protein Csx1 [Thermococcus waiotapuensis]|uniref:CRISPR-associated CARF protein Csx1 n=1 Tax=Thermococcus waiotapuensis TaxID=90909 RepID=A0AAE4NY59_9EURY|nr:CRISPR-associated CARF protein Csx1 [Thermococcus waiotapuensis]MDV3104835.1 CRISPR-associated CARF protein Csx1 [Thermococcus waiotapuensis]